MIDKLEFLIALARERNFSRAADSCGVTQPTLSAGIKQLEEALGVLLVNRSSRFYGLTPEGERVLEWARRIVSDARAMRQDVRASKTALAGHLTIAVVPTALPIAAELTTPFQAKYPGVQFTILSRASRDILVMLDDFQIDAALTYIENEPLGDVHTVLLYRERYRLLTSAGSPLAERAEVTWAEAGRIGLCLLTPDMQNRRIIDRLLARSGPPPEPPLESDSILVLFSHVRTGRYACIMPEKFTSLLGVREPLRAIPVIEPLETQAIGLVSPRREPIPAITHALITEAARLSNGRRTQ
ncbi:MAG: LysR family transcriptional regulator [Methylocapsa sp.]|nr:LysR family transcriptional regulator [Methylocapsa sp.]